MLLCWIYQTVIIVDFYISQIQNDNDFIAESKGKRIFKIGEHFGFFDSPCSLVSNYEASTVSDQLSAHYQMDNRM